MLGRQETTELAEAQGAQDNGNYPQERADDDPEEAKSDDSDYQSSGG